MTGFRKRTWTLQNTKWGYLVPALYKISKKANRLFRTNLNDFCEMPAADDPILKIILSNSRKNTIVIPPLYWIKHHPVQFNMWMRKTKKKSQINRNRKENKDKFLKNSLKW